MFRSATVSSVKIVLMIMGVALLAGCAVTSDRMATVPEPASVSSPPRDKATVVFYRSSVFGGAVQASVFDISTEPPRLVGIISSSTKLAYVSDPGTRRFMVIGESADFMDAELAPGKTYYALVAPRVGVWKARFSLRPRQADDPEVAEQVTGLSWVENTPQSQQWAQENMSDIQQKRQEYLLEWQAKPDKPLLNASDGR
jgi:hypothetical protein